MRITVEFPIGDQILYAAFSLDADATVFEYQWPNAVRTITKQLTDEVQQ